MGILIWAQNTFSIKKIHQKMLKEQDKERIKAEEIFRNEIRKNLESKKGNKIWGFLNSALGLWFLSTIVLGIATSMYTNYSLKSKEQIRKRILIQKLDIEIESRLSQFLFDIESFVTKKYDNCNGYVFKDTNSLENTIKSWQALKRPPTERSNYLNSIFPEFENRGLISLLMELSTHVNDIEKEKLRDATIAISGNLIFYDRKTDDYIYNLNSKEHDFMFIWHQIRNTIILKRWQNRFPYTDCLETPFC